MRFLIRVLIGIVCWTIGRRDVRFRWLAHYLIGDGSPLQVQGPEREEATEAAARYARYFLEQGVVVKPPGEGKLFWLVGCWTARLDGNVVRGVDRYDWHPSDTGWEWATTPISFPLGLGMLLPKSFGVTAEGKLKVSDKFWALIGGTEFDTIIEFSVSELVRFTNYLLNFPLRFLQLATEF